MKSKRRGRPPMPAHLRRVKIMLGLAPMAARLLARESVKTGKSKSLLASEAVIKMYGGDNEKGT